MPNASPDRESSPEELAKDAVSVVQQLCAAWDGEVDVVVLLVPKDLGPTRVIAARSIVSNDYYRTVLRTEMGGIGTDKDIKGVGGKS